MINKKTLIALATLSLSLSGCALFTPYSAPVQQGKIITAKDIQQLKPGMTESQIQFILGTPDIIDPFNKDTWYYVYTIKYYNTTMEDKSLYLTFSKGKLQNLAGDYPPPEVIEYTEPQSDQAATDNKPKTKEVTKTSIK